MLLDRGRVVQYGTPETLLEHPATAFAARFLGTDRALKRLSRMTGPTARSRRSASTLADGTLTDYRNGPGRFDWVTDAGGRLLGNLDSGRFPKVPTRKNRWCR